MSETKPVYTDDFSQAYMKWSKENPIKKGDTETITFEFLTRGTGPTPFITKKKKIYEKN